ncbi:glycosyltransferase family 2 protein [Arthrobacter sp. PAMC25284]|uniref:glycosyltransferase family 2 protein n=1 Tax=Arthrobacter sp. PAMC25284 TaxID=2861279 RepID=UPI001C634880|nr:glycosyltransferase [Arthrobacter sp. PAMC25284]QYF89691.1 glycosyltransferase [Arthrobacter sp. PAMC25284]
MALDIFIPYWGDVPLMKMAVESVLAQTNGEWRLTVVDDAYPGDEIRRYVTGLDDPRITYLRKDTNEGITENFRTCVSLASQEVLVVMGCDDLLLPNYVDVVLSAHAAFPQAWIIQPGVQIIDESGNPAFPLVDIVKQRLVKPRGSGARIVSGEPLAVSLLHGDWLYWPSLAFRTDRIRDYDFRDGFPVIQDLALVIDMVLGGAELLIEPETCFEYRRHTSSASAAKLVDGSRFTGERDYFALAERLCAAKGWRKAAGAARLRLTSRAHALLFVPGATRRIRTGPLGTLLRHAFGK